MRLKLTILSFILICIIRENTAQAILPTADEISEHIIQRLPLAQADLTRAEASVSVLRWQ